MLMALFTCLLDIEKKVVSIEQEKGFPAKYIVKPLSSPKLKETKSTSTEDSFI